MSPRQPCAIAPAGPAANPRTRRRQSPFSLLPRHGTRGMSFPRPRKSEEGLSKRINVPSFSRPFSSCVGNVVRPPALRIRRKLEAVAHLRGDPRTPDLQTGNLMVGSSAIGCVSRVSPVQTALRNCTRDEGGPFGFGDQELIPSYRKLLWSKARVVSVAEKSGR